MTTAEAIKSQLDIATVVADYVTLKRNGSRMVGLCPFHTEKTPSFGVNIRGQFFKCFGCPAKGDVIRFVQEIEGISFTAAVARLVERYGVTLPEQGEAAPRPTYSDADAKLARCWQHGMGLWIEDELARMKGQITDADFEMGNSPKSAMIQFWTRRQATLREMGGSELVAEYLQAKRADARHADYCIQRARRNVAWWRKMTDLTMLPVVAAQAA
jgi:DNA primase catalytic core